MRIKFFLPESNDLVDPSFNYLKDSYGHNRKGIESDVYAHELFSKPNFDGLLVTKSNINLSAEQKIQSAGGVHKFFRLDKRYPIMGDCGAFQFIKEKKPPYTCEEICSYYDKLGFDYGITLDHVILDFNVGYDLGHLLFKMAPTDDMKLRYKLTLDNAKKMLHIMKQRNANFKLIGSVQGWSPRSYREGVEKLISYGFKYIALGGVAKAPNEVIVPILKEIRPAVLRSEIKLHILGVARLNIIDEYKKTNVYSCDSASSIMQAFKSQKDNYHALDESYTAIRIPAVYGNASPKVRKYLEKYSNKKSQAFLSAEKNKLAKLEKAALSSVRLYAKRKAPLKQAMKALIKYEDKLESERKYYQLFEKTLLDRPWESCSCAICHALGVEVVILRGNNRNRRRGFHNTYVFYQKFKKIT